MTLIFLDIVNDFKLYDLNQTVKLDVCNTAITIYF